MTEISIPQQEGLVGFGWPQRIRDRIPGIRKASTDPLTEAQKIEARKVNGYFNHEMAKSEGLMFAVVDRFAGGFKEGRFGLIIADDTSARLPGLVLREVASEVSRREGKPVAPLFFIDAGSRSTKEQIEERAANISERVKGQENKKALVVTELMHSGYSMEFLYNGLRVEGISADIAALEAANDKYYNIHLSPDSTLFIARNIGETKSSLHQRAFLTGVVRDPKTTEIEPLKSDDPKQQEANMEMVTRARQDVHLMAQRAIDRIYPISSNNPQATLSQS